MITPDMGHQYFSCFHFLNIFNAKFLWSSIIGAEINNKMERGLLIGLISHLPTQDQNTLYTWVTNLLQRLFQGAPGNLAPALEKLPPTPLSFEQQEKC